MLQQLGQILVRIQAILNSSLDQAKHYRTAGGSLRGIGKQEVLPVNDERLNASFRTVVGDLQSAAGWYSYRTIGFSVSPLVRYSHI